MSQTLQINRCLYCNEVLFDETKSYHAECWKQKRRDDSRDYQYKKRFQKNGFRKCRVCNGVITKRHKQKYCTPYHQWLNEVRNHNTKLHKKIMRLVSKDGGD